MARCRRSDRHDGLVWERHAYPLAGPNFIRGCGMSTESNWTVFIDESGRFDAKEREALIVGGVLCPGSRPNLDAGKRFSRTAGKLGATWPPHSTDLREEDRARLLAAAHDQVGEARGRWLFLVSRPTREARNAVTAYLQMLGSFVDLAARIAALEGCKRLSVVVAQRTVSMPTLEVVRQAEKEGLGRIEGHFPSGEGIPFRSFVEGEVRQVFDGLAREEQGDLPSLPALEKVSVSSASSSTVDAGIICADFGCNGVYRLASERTSSGFGTPETVIVVDRNDASQVRRVDRRLRETPPDVHGAARTRAALEARSQAADPGTGSLSPRGSLQTCDLLWTRGIEALAQRTPSNRIEPIAHALAGAAFAALAAKTGSYEGTWLAMESAWAGTGALAEKMRASVRDRDLGARLWRCVFECANHRGDVANALRAGHEFQRICDPGGSLWLLAENLAVRNFAAVAAQNRLPAPTAQVERLIAELVASAEGLRQVADEAGDLVALAASRRGEPSRPDPGERELALWKALGRPYHGSPPDKERGRILGTAARSLAFANDLERSLEWVLDARALFDEPFDLTFNSAVLARILLEQARLGDHRRGNALSLALSLAGADLEPRVAEKLLASDSGARFAVDIVLRAILWAPGSREAEPRWRKALAEDGKDSLYARLVDQRSHPTELIARHAGELLLRGGDEPGAKRWFDLSLALSDGAPTDSAIRRFGTFTRLVASGGGVPAGAPLGSTENPSFEYR